jgi:hypothetical protein
MIFLCVFCAVGTFADALSCGADFVQLIGNQCLLVARLGNGMEEMKKAADAAHPSDFIAEIWLRGEDLNL